MDEALVFSYVLAGFAIPGASEMIQTYGAIGIAAVVSILLVALTHATGTQIYKNSRVLQARKAWQASDNDSIWDYSSIDLDETFEDDKKPVHSQILSRHQYQSVTPKNTISIITAILIIVVAVGSTYVRSTVLEKELISEVSGSQQNYFDMDVPAELAVVASTAEKKAIEESVDLDRKGGWTTFIILAFIFIFIQVIGVLFGYKWGFSGKQSKVAYNKLGKGRFHTIHDVEEHAEKIIDAAQARLERLQQKLTQNNANTGGEKVQTKKTFEDYLLETAQDKHDKKIGHESISQATESKNTNASGGYEAEKAENTVDNEISSPDEEIKKLKAELARAQQAKEAKNKAQEKADEIAELKRQLEETK